MLDYNKLSISQKYVALALAADSYLEDQPVVFHYFGPAELKNFAAEFKKGGLKEIVSRLNELEEEACKELNDEFPVYKRSYLVSMIRSVRGLLAFSKATLHGEALLAAVTTVLGINPPEPFDINTIQKRFTSTLSSCGYGSYEEFKFDQEAVARKFTNTIDNDYIMDLVALLKRACAEQIIPNIFCGKRLLPILLKSKIKMAKEEKERPPCYYVYKGGWKGEMAISSDHRKNRIQAIRTIMHELLPGHHLYSLYREMLYDLGYLGEEATIDLLYSAETPVNEGIAETAPLFLLNVFDEETKRAIEVMTSMEHYCKKLLYNVWYHRFVEQKMSEASALEYIKEVGNIEDEKATTWLKFIDEWRLYYPSYPVGISSIQDYIEGTSLRGVAHLYLPKTVSSVLKLKEYYNMSADERRIYEKNSREAILSYDDMRN